MVVIPTFIYLLSFMLRLQLLLRARQACTRILTYKELLSQALSCLLRARNIIKQNLSLKIELSRFKIPVLYYKSLYQSTITFVNNARIILIQQVLKSLNVYLLQLYFSKISLTLNSSSIKNQKNKTRLTFSPKTNLRTFFNRGLENQLSL